MDIATAVVAIVMGRVEEAAAEDGQVEEVGIVILEDMIAVGGGEVGRRVLLRMLLIEDTTPRIILSLG